LISLEGPAPAKPLGTFSAFTAADAAKLARRRDVQIDVGGGRRVQTFVVEPVNPPPGPKKSYLWIHGGPVSAWTDGWHWRWSPLLLAAQGYTVILPNPAGSTGFGNSWINDIWGNTWGAQCYDDLMAVVDHFAATEDLQPANMIVMGGSFGGYMSNWIGANTDRFKLLITHASIFSLAGFYGVTDVPAWWSLMMGGSPFEGDVDFERYSPSAHVKGWRTPTLILHGERDYRVPVGESLQLFEALQAEGVPSEFAVFPDENHWITKPNNIIAWYETVFDFVARHDADAL
ncbi:MAG: dipeptidyl aminopeptidase/acylaminoacyl peptidase, partial [Myxococcota bacterium]